MEDSTISHPRVSMKNSIQESVVTIEADVNDRCHNYTGGVKANRVHTIPNPQIVLILWGNYYSTHPDAVTSAQTLITDLVTGSFMNGLVQYGIAPGSLIKSIVIDTNALSPAPPTINEDQLRDQLINWIKAGTVSPAPSVNEVNLLYFILPPTNTQLTLKNGTKGFCGYHQHAKYNSASSDDDVFWAVVETTGATQNTGQQFISSVSYCVSHELVEAFSDRDGQGFKANSDNGCEIGDICEKKLFFTYRGWTLAIEQYWSNWDNTCIQGDQPISLRTFLNEIGFDPKVGLRSLHTSVINRAYIASKVNASLISTLISKCAELSEAIAEATSEIESLSEDLKDASPQQKPSIVQRIKFWTNKREVAENQARDLGCALR